MRPIVASTSRPVSANRLATSRNVSPETPNRAAITSFSSTTPTEVSSASNTRARRIIEAGCTPVVVNRSKNSRSAKLNVTGRFFCEGIANSPDRQRRRGSLPPQPRNETGQN
ncbi:hypothetical protein Rwratislav_36104 [Rhodococcus wratislaviensis IFP 2016]|nr:hypothetical protein Rwratislav_36104 [Rhodococcus wratislaviensis IFP 2016]